MCARLKDNLVSTVQGTFTIPFKNGVEAEALAMTTDVWYIIVDASFLPWPQREVKDLELWAS